MTSRHLTETHMANKDDEPSDFFTAAQAAIDFGGPGYGEDPVLGFNTASRHVLVLLEDAVAAFARGSYGTSVFLAITALEETAKAEILGLRIRKPEGAQKKRGDPLRSHMKKHALAVRPTTFMGRLPKILGAETCARLQQEAADSTINRLRETAIYASCSAEGKVSTPAMAVDKTRAREIVLLALESADDILVGWTSDSYQLGESLETFIAQVS
jgi:AbiV family abortive infection protein